MPTMLGHLRSPIRSLYDFSLYREVTEQRAGRTVVYFLIAGDGGHALLGQQAEISSVPAHDDQQPPNPSGSAPRTD